MQQRWWLYCDGNKWCSELEKKKEVLQETHVLIPFLTLVLATLLRVLEDGQPERPGEPESYNLSLLLQITRVS